MCQKCAECLEKFTVTTLIDGIALWIDGIATLNTLAWNMLYLTLGYIRTLTYNTISFYIIKRFVVLCISISLKYDQLPYMSHILLLFAIVVKSLYSVENDNFNV